MNDTESYTFEDRVYLNPETSRDERLSFIDTLRQTQQGNTAQVNADTYALGSQVPSNLGGLGGSEGTFTARYQKPQTDATIAQLREAAQAQALNTAMSNLTNAWKKRYQDAINNYRRRSLTPSTTTPKNPSNNDDDELPINTNPSGESLGVRLGTAGIAASPQYNAAQQAALEAQKQGGAASNSRAFQFKLGDTTQYGVAYIDSLGRITSVDTPMQNFRSSSAAQQYLTDLANQGALFDARGVPISSINLLLGV